MTLSTELLRKLKSAPIRESDLQRSVARVLDLSGLTWFHCPNGGKRNKTEAAIMKAHGVKAGVPDVLVFHTPATGFKGLAIELKVGLNTPTDTQLAWHQKLQDAGWIVRVCYTLDDALAVLRSYYPNKFPT